ncbi:MAG: hypothetical protein PHS44_01155 [Candidatus Dojkabacteria bacterium]|jgi:hypothetical protein|nr:hypothetical protein [Candidatus Dojkabacteria bacterium]
MENDYEVPQRETALVLSSRLVGGNFSHGDKVTYFGNVNPLPDVSDTGSDTIKFHGVSGVLVYMDHQTFLQVKLSLPLSDSTFFEVEYKYKLIDGRLVKQHNSGKVY